MHKIDVKVHEKFVGVWLDNNCFSKNMFIKLSKNLVECVH